jgi:hypothetical protein
MHVALSIVTFGLWDFAGRAMERGRAASGMKVRVTVTYSEDGHIESVDRLPTAARARSAPVAGATLPPQRVPGFDRTCPSGQAEEMGGGVSGAETLRIGECPRQAASAFTSRCSAKARSPLSMYCSHLARAVNGDRQELLLIAPSRSVAERAPCAGTRKRRISRAGLPGYECRRENCAHKRKRRWSTRGSCWRTGNRGHP